jgi:hypothetical protein
VFTGALTYGARHRMDAVRIGFWDDLDYVGALLYPSWKETVESEPERSRVRGAYRHQMLGLAEVAIEARKPWLVVQVGFPSAAEAWRESWVPLGPPASDLQLEALDALAEAFANGGRGHPELAGSFLWSWSCDPEAGGPDDRGFSPQNKEAEAALPALFAAPR